MYLNRILKAFIGVVLLFLLGNQTVSAQSENVTIPVWSAVEMENAIYSMDLSPDGNTAVVGINGDAIKFYDTTTAQLVDEVDAGGTAKEVIYSPDGSMIASRYSYKDGVDLWDENSKEIIMNVGSELSVGKIKFLSNETILTTSRETLYFWDVQTGKKVNTMKFDSHINSLAINSKDNELAVATKNKTIHIRNTETSEHVKTIYDLESLQYGYDVQVSYTPNQTQLIASVTDYNPFIFDVEGDYNKLKEAPSFEAIYGNSLEKHFALSNEGRFFAMIGDKNTANLGSDIFIFDYSTGELISSARGVDSLYFTPDNEKIVGYDYDTLYFLDSSELNNIQHLDQIEVTPVPPLTLNDSYELQLTGHSGGEEVMIPSENVQWETSNYNVAFVDEGKIHTRSQGEAIITGNYQGIEFETKVTVTSSVPDNAEEFKVWNSQYNVSPEKVWAVEYNIPIDISTITDKNMFITNEHGEIISALYIIDRSRDSSKISMKAIESYNKGENYTLWIKDIKGENGKVLKENVKMDFFIAD
ncbi:hypothetical protein IMZ31_16805 [Pontibacillus sp. ALD_SL1]|uniref:WD40 repeat domain-containing protein n=1 Tax=Pontibacillus sp. ALD_SL1 TaxID=2777185 RepID=UPI001A97685D|nr:hypothetical protein [Pontibacillus sp. ALD_SL1]QSS99702.1 hypothetical protein IMZ31_16805 [Pontibacillus sp. ALD_SL1]